MALVQEIGAVNAILSAIRTKVDGSVIVSIECNPQEIQVLNKLMQCYLTDKRLFSVAFVQVDE